MKEESPSSSRSIQYYVAATKWNSDLNFFKIEASFFRRLLDRRLKNVFPTGSAVAQWEIRQKLEALETEQCYTEKKLGMQLREIELMAEDVIPENIDALVSMQVQLEFAMAALTKTFREVKKEIFGLIDGDMISSDTFVA